MSERIFLTGATGFIGGYTTVALLEARPDVEVVALVRARSIDDAYDRLWQQLQLHWDIDSFRRMAPRIVPVLGDLHAPGLGIAPDVRRRLAKEIDSILHIAASLNRKSAKACLNTNLRGTLSVLNLAREIQAGHGLRRYSHVSTVAVAGHRNKEVVQEDEAIDWDRSDYDPYARTKKFCEHMARELLPDVPKTFFRPSIVMGDSRPSYGGRTSQFDMVRAFCFFADLPLIPLRPDDRMDIVPADWVARAVAHIHMKDAPAHDTYHLSAGEGAESARAIATAMAAVTGKKPRFAPWLLPGFKATADTLARSSGKNLVTLVGSLVSVFLPYLVWDTVFDNRRIVAELGEAPTPFTTYGGPVYEYAKKVGYKFPTTPLPPAPAPAVGVVA
ncbi:MAG: SDR family oxidoreductase [Deltaproteobacteria bacterium]|nr:SDR family oxidoreductase [Deltaproteobacteria bacterium]